MQLSAPVTREHARAIKGRFILVSIAGPQGSGKTLLTDFLKAACKANGIQDITFIETQSQGKV